MLLLHLFFVFLSSTLAVECPVECGGICKDVNLPGVCSCEGIRSYYDATLGKCTSCALNLFASQETETHCLTLEQCQANGYAYTQTEKCYTTCQGNLLSTEDKYCVNDTCPQGQYQFQHTCVDTCPTETYIYDFKCLESDCTINSLLLVENTRTCVEACTGDYYLNGNSCIQHCPKSTHVDEHKCVDSCGEDDKSSVDGSLCYNTCIVYTIEDPLYSKYCIDNCFEANQGGYIYTDEINKHCVSECPAYIKYLDTTTNKCVASCDSTLFVSEDDTQCLETCPNYFEGQRCIPTCDKLSNGKECIERCPEGKKTNLAENTCVDDCGELVEYNNTCYTDGCPENYFNCESMCVGSCHDLCEGAQLPYLIDKKCYSECPQDTFLSLNGLSCVDACEENEFSDFANKKCVGECDTTLYILNTFDAKECYAAQCKVEQYTVVETKQCLIGGCQDFYSDVDTESKMCHTTCDTKTDLINKQCVTECPITLVEVTVDGKVYCNNTCPGQLKNVAEPNVRPTCVDQCPELTIQLDDMCIKSCERPNYQVISTNQCVSKCPYTHYEFSYNYSCLLDCTGTEMQYKFDNGTYKKCYTSCPNGNYTFESGLTCYPNGCREDLFTYGMKCYEDCTAIEKYNDMKTKTCITRTSCKKYFYETNSSCLTSCGDLKRDKDQLQCYDECTGTLFAHEDDLICYSICPNNMKKDYVTNYCVNTCDKNTTYYYENDESCKEKCDKGLYTDDINKKCYKEQCPSNLFFTNTADFTCDVTCPSNYYVDGLRKFCYNTSCPENYLSYNTYQCYEKNCPPNTMKLDLI
ncbi:hypothetical protein EIN_341750, partial [Entamoeba invadens IP1]